MPVRIALDDLLARAGLTAREVSACIGVSETHLSLFRSGKVRGVRFSTLAKLCLVLDCQPGELLVYDQDPADLGAPGEGDND